MRRHFLGPWHLGEPCCCGCGERRWLRLTEESHRVADNGMPIHSMHYAGGPTVKRDV